MSQKIDVSIISSGANIGDARLHRLTNALLRQGLSVEIFAPGNQADAPAISKTEGGEFYPPSTPLIVRSCTSPWTRGKGFCLDTFEAAHLFSELVAKLFMRFLLKSLCQRTHG